MYTYMHVIQAIVNSLHNNTYITLVIHQLYTSNRTCMQARGWLVCRFDETNKTSEDYNK